MSLITRLTVPSFDAQTLVGASIENLRDQYPLPPSLATFRDDHDLLHGFPDYKFEQHYLVSNNGIMTYTLDPACAGKLWDMGMKVSDYVSRASLSNRVPPNLPITCDVAPSAYEELGLPSPGIFDPRTTGRNNLLAVPLPFHELKDLLQCKVLKLFSYFTNEHNRL
jgi:hypothetical protein